MVSDGSPKRSEDPLPSSSVASTGKQRKRRKWDEPAEPITSTVAAGIPLNISAVFGTSIPSVPLYPVAPLGNFVPVTCALTAQLAPSAPILSSAAAVVQKLNQAKIQDELIAREIVINDAAPSIRYRLTKRQTLEEIEKCTGSIVIIRGKYRPPNTPADSEKPLYLHISAGTHLKDTAERIKAVDHAASMVEEIMKQGLNLHASSMPIISTQNNGQGPFSTCVYLGFQADPSSNVAARIRGPNDQYVNHIINETGAAVVLRGKDSGNSDNSHSEAAQQPLHLCISSMHTKSIEAARILAEHLLDTIAVEFGASRNSSSKVYSAVPPPKQLIACSQSGAVMPDANTSLAAGMTLMSGLTMPNQSSAYSGTSVSSGTNAYPPAMAVPAALSSFPGMSTVSISDITPRITGGTCYNGYEGIYPQATPLQQVALALKQAPSTLSSMASSSVVTANATQQTSISHLEEKRMPTKRKFQELPVSNGITTEPQNSQQGSEFVKSGLEDPRLHHYMPNGKSLHGYGANEIPQPAAARSLNGIPQPASARSMLAPSTRSSEMPPPPPRKMVPPPPRLPTCGTVSTEPSNLSSDRGLSTSQSSKTNVSSSLPSPCPPAKQHNAEKTSRGPISDTLLKLADYSSSDDDDEDGAEAVRATNQVSRIQGLTPKPFWAV